MSLVKIEDYQGDLISKTVLETLDIIGLTAKLSINGYHIYIFGVYGDMPKGLIEDTPSSHTIIIERNKYLPTIDYESFKKIENDPLKLDEIIEDQEKSNLDFLDDDNKEISHIISYDKDGYVWYKHKLSFNSNKMIVETYDSYIKRMFESIADYVIGSFEDMEKS